MYDIVTIGSATRDIVIRTGAGKVVQNPQDPLVQRILGFEYGAKIPVLRTYDNFGGGGCNVAIGLSRLKLRVAARVNVGQDIEGLRIKKKLRQEKVSTALLTWDRRQKTDLSVVIVDEKGEGDHIIFVDKNASNSLSLDGKKFSTRWVYVSSLTGNWQKVLKDLIALVSRKNIRLVFNPGGLQLATGFRGLKEIFPHVEIIILSLDEAVELVLSKDKKASLKPKDLSQEIFSWGLKLVVITEGKRGALAYDGIRLRKRKASQVSKVVDTTGAGDAFASGFVGARVLGKDIETALDWGVRNSGHVVREYGAQVGLLTRREMEKMKK